MVDIGDNSVGKIKGPAPVGPISLQEAELLAKIAGVDSGLSSIEKSKSVIPENILLMSVPVLSVPTNADSLAFAVASLDAGGRPVTSTVMSFVMKGEEVKDDMLKGWATNLREIEEQVRQLLSSPLYIQLQEIWLKGEPQSGSAPGVEGKALAGAAVQGEVPLLSSLDRLQVLERLPPTAEVSSPTAPKESAQVLILPLAAAMLAGAGIAIGTELVTSANPLSGVTELVQQLQPIFPQVSIQDLIPVINLMAVAPIYYNSWNEAVSNLKSGERHSYVQTAQNFAKDVIKIVTDPDFVQKTLISRMRGTDKLSPESQERLARMLKIVLIGVALSLLYSVEVGKVQGGKEEAKFGGMTPEELRDLILGKFAPDPKKKMNAQEQLTGSLIKRIHEQMQTLSPEDREFAVNLLLNYITEPRELDPMLDPAKVFDETLSSSLFNPQDKSDRLKG